MIFSVYAVQTGGTSLWSEGQDVTFDDKGTYSVLLGANHAAGLPRALFAQGEALWLGIQIDGQPEEKRILLVSVPYALKAGDAETIGGRPLSAFVLAGPSTPRAEDGLHYLEGAGTPPGSPNGNPTAVRPLTASVAAITATGTLNQVAKFDGSGNLVNASLFDNGKVGIGTLTPAQALDVAGSVNLSGKLFLPATTATAGAPTAGVLYLGGSPALHAFPGAAGYNLFVGPNAGNFSMGGTGIQGSYNTTLGAYSLRANTTGNGNMAVGYGALYGNTTGSGNTAIGKAALYASTTGNNNVAIGSLSGRYSSTASGNTGIGTSSLQNLTTGSNNIALGLNAGINLTTESNDINIGHAGVASDSGTIRIGTAGNQTRAFLAGITGVTPAGANPLPVIIDANGQLGTQAWGTAAGSFNTAVGAGSLAVNTGTNNTATGWDALNANSTGSENNAFGMMSLAANNTGSYNAAFGSSSLTSNTTGNSNSAFGFHSLFGNQTGGFNAAFGAYALSANSTGNSNVAMGYYALTGNTTAVGNVAIGTEALSSQSFANAGVNWSSYNTAVGHYALAANQPTDTSTGLQNTAVGAYAAWQNSTGSYNSAFGLGALYSNTTAQQNTALGAYALFAVTAGGSNTAVGSNSLVSLTMGSDNIAVGKNSGQSYTSSESNNILIGNLGVAAESNVIRIGTSGTHNTAFVSGIRGVTPASLDTLPVVIDANGQLGTAPAISAANLGVSQTGTVRAVGINYIISLYGIFPSNSTGSATYTSQMIGEIRMFAGTYAPQGWAFCDGALLSISSNTALFSILGTTYGGNGTTTFALPDLRSAVPMHTQQ